MERYMFKLLLMYTDGRQTAHTHGLWPTVPQLGTIMHLQKTAFGLVDSVMHSCAYGMIVVFLRPDPKSPFLASDNFETLVDECGWGRGRVAEWGQYFHAEWSQLGYSPEI
jgi:hypothetical protein